MKKLILKTALITLGVALILAVSLFGIVSFCAPASMMRFCESIGLDNLSGEYAYQEYENTKNLQYLAHSFEIAAANGSYSRADERFEELYGEADSPERKAFGEFCASQDNSSLPGDPPDYEYRSYLCGRAAAVKYHLALTYDDRTALCAFAIEESAPALIPESPVISLALEAIGQKDAAFCGLLLVRVRGTQKFDKENEHYRNLVNFLEEAVNEQ